MSSLIHNIQKHTIFFFQWKTFAAYCCNLHPYQRTLTFKQSILWESHKTYKQHYICSHIAITYEGNKNIQAVYTKSCSKLYHSETPDIIETNEVITHAWIALDNSIGNAACARTSRLQDDILFMNTIPMRQLKHSSNGE